jgi:glutamate-1-semialdehyde 2,1-aminomutase
MGRAADLPRLLHLELLNRGIFLAPRGLFSISTAMSEQEVAQAITAVADVLQFLRPHAAAVAPHLVIA